MQLKSYQFKKGRSPLSSFALTPSGRWKKLVINSQFEFVPLTMHVEVRVILTLLAVIRNEGSAQMLEDLSLQNQNLPMETCTTMMVSYSADSRGK